ncbi:hypothetical protein M407DRAFT_244429, partial [Tulasnella calospora MUT 4182]
MHYPYTPATQSTSSPELLPDALLVTMVVVHRCLSKQRTATMKRMPVLGGEAGTQEGRHCKKQSIS